jgi:CheY-like chemotaxis protein
MDGFETAEMLKRHHKTRDVPIIFLTAAEDSRDATFRGYAVGAADYITKPFDPWVLRAKVLVFVDLYRKNRTLADVASRLASVEDQLRRLIPSSAPPAAAAAGNGLDGPPGKGAETLAQLAERIAVLQATVRALFPADDLVDTPQSGRLAPRPSPA